jgi:PAS domain S-box-containing protein
VWASQSLPSSRSIATHALLGLDAAEMLGQSIERIIPPKLRTRHRAGFRRYVQTGASRLPEITVSTGLAKGDALVRLAISVAALRNAAGEIVGVAAVLNRAE